LTLSGLGNVLRLARTIIVATLTLLLTGCPTGGRWDRHSNGGSFIGARPNESPKGNEIVFSSPSSGNGDIYCYDAARSTSKQVTCNPSYEGDPKYSPDGTQIVFIREENDVANVWLMNSDGTQQTQITFSPAYDSGPSFSSDGRQIVFTRNVTDSRFRRGSALSAETFIVDADGTDETRLTDNDVADFEPSFSPDGKQILFCVAAQHIWIMDVDGNNATRIGAGSSPSFSPDGSSIAYVSGQYGRELSVMDADGNNSRPIFQSKHFMSHPIYSADGLHITFLDQPTASGVGIIRKIDLSDQSVEEITTTHR